MYIYIETTNQAGRKTFISLDEIIAVVDDTKGSTIICRDDVMILSSESAERIMEKIKETNLINEEDDDDTLPFGDNPFE